MTDAAACVWFVNPVQCLWFTGVDVGKKKWTEMNMQDVGIMEEMLRFTLVRFTRMEKDEEFYQQDQEGYEIFLLFFCTLISKSPKGGYGHVGGLLFSNTSCCGYIYSGVSEHYLSCRGDNDSMHNQRLMVEMMCQHLEYSLM